MYCGDFFIQGVVTYSSIPGLTAVEAFQGMLFLAGGIRLYVDSANEQAQATYQAMGMVSHYAVFEEEFQR